jgi:hypothetical protein
LYGICGIIRADIVIALLIIIARRKKHDPELSDYRTAGYDPVCAMQGAALRLGLRKDETRGPASEHLVPE